MFVKSNLNLISVLHSISRRITNEKNIPVDSSINHVTDRFTIRSNAKADHRQSPLVNRQDCSMGQELVLDLKLNIGEVAYRHKGEIIILRKEITEKENTECQVSGYKDLEYLQDHIIKIRFGIQ